MKSTISIFVFALIVLSGCNKEGDIEPGDNLLLNGSFEDNGNFSMDGWVSTSSDSETDVPAGGGNFSMKIAPETSPSEGYAEYEITGITGTKTFSLTCYINSFGDWPGSIALRKITSGGALTILGIEASSLNSWELLTIDATTTLATGDKLIVRISSGSTEAITPDKYALFDLIVLKEE